jgi:NAD-dependent dihydropyrimidine dehydrogenase PreA subunit/nitroreductase
MIEATEQRLGGAAMVIIDTGRCTGCGTCVKICHEHCMSLANASVAISYEACSTCTQCIAICPRKALSWNGAEPVPFEPALLPSAEQMEELFRERRSVRDFLPEALPRDLLVRITAAGGFAPTNNYSLRVVATDDEAVIRDIDAAVVRFTRTVYRLVFRPRVVFSLLRAVTPGVTATDRVKMQAVMERGQNFRSFPAAMVFVTGDPRIALSRESAQCALVNMFYCAQSLGVATCLFGPGRIVLDRDRRVRARLGLDSREHILGTLLLGRPAVRFSNKVTGKPLQVRWVGNR